MTRSPWLRVYDMQLFFALFRLGFPLAPDLLILNQLHTVTRRLILQKARHKVSPVTFC